MVIVDGKRYAICNVCNATEILYFPQPHQAEFHRDTHTFKAIFGAYGSGKTTTAVMSIVNHVLSVPYGRTALLAPTMQLLKGTLTLSPIYSHKRGETHEGRGEANS